MPTGGYFLLDAAKTFAAQGYYFKLFLFERLRVRESKIFFLSLRFLGVTSSSSSKPRYSIESSSVISLGGVSIIASSDPAALILVSFFVLQGLISRSSGLEFCPIIIPS